MTSHVLAATASVSGTHDWLFLIAGLVFLGAGLIAVIAIPERATRFMFGLIALGLALASFARLFK